MNTQVEYVEYAKSFSFIVGESYLHNWGEYKVLSIKGDKLYVIFANSEKKELTKDLAKKIHLNKVLEVMKPNIMKPQNFKYIAEDKPYAEEFNYENFMWTLGTFARYVNLKAEVGGEKHIDKFVKRYGNSVGSTTKKELEFNNNILFIQRYKTGQELRLHIPSKIIKDKRFCLPGIGHIEESTKEKTVHKINNCQLVWMLIERWGFQLSSQQNYSRIFANIKEEFQFYFNDGYSFKV